MFLLNESIANPRSRIKLSDINNPNKEKVTQMILLVKKEKYKMCNYEIKCTLYKKMCN